MSSELQFIERSTKKREKITIERKSSVYRIIRVMMRYIQKKMGNKSNRLLLTCILTALWTTLICGYFRKSSSVVSFMMISWSAQLSIILVLSAMRQCTECRKDMQIVSNRTLTFDATYCTLLCRFRSS